MKVKLGYPDRVVEISGKMVYLFKKRLYSAPLEEVLNYYLRGEGLLAPPLRRIAPDVVRIVMNSGEFEGSFGEWKSAGQGIST